MVDIPKLQPRSINESNQEKPEKTIVIPKKAYTKYKEGEAIFNSEYTIEFHGIFLQITKIIDRAVQDNHLKCASPFYDYSSMFTRLVMKNVSGYLENRRAYGPRQKFQIIKPPKNADKFKTPKTEQQRNFYDSGVVEDFDRVMEQTYEFLDKMILNNIFGIAKAKLIDSVSISFGKLWNSETDQFVLAYETAKQKKDPNSTFNNNMKLKLINDKLKIKKKEIKKWEQLTDSSRTYATEKNYRHMDDLLDEIKVLKKERNAIIKQQNELL